MPAICLAGSDDHVPSRHGRAGQGSVLGERCPTTMVRLRHDTAAAHRRVEQAMMAGGWLHERVRYVSLLARLLRLHVHIEAQLAELTGALSGLADLDLVGRARSPLLAKDLLALSGGPATVPAGPADADRRPPPLLVLNVGSALGALYVIEGSTLGGRIIAAQLEADLGLTARHGAASFNPYGAQTRRRWREFGGVVQGWVSDETRYVQVLGGAAGTFGVYEGWVLADASSTVTG